MAVTSYHATMVVVKRQETRSCSRSLRSGVIVALPRPRMAVTSEWLATRSLCATLPSLTPRTARMAVTS
jgi:hypothetical protein